MLLREAKEILKRNGYMVESIGAEEMFMNKVKLELLDDKNFMDMFGEDEIDTYIERYHDGLMDYMMEDPESYGVAARWLKEMIYEE